MNLARRNFVACGGAFLAVTALWPRRSLGSCLAERAEAPDPSAGIGAEGGDPPALREVSRLLPGFDAARSRGWVLLSDVPPSLAASTLALLDATAAQVARAVDAVGAARRAAPHRHLAILFRSLDRYRDFASAHDGFQDSNAAGHYAATGRRSAFAAPEPSPALRRALESRGIDAAPTEIAGGSVDPSRRPSRADRSGAAFRAAVDEAVDDLEQRMRRVTSHEAAHQVLFETGVHPEPGRCPAWLAEGLACCFETERSLGDFGPEHDVPSRRERLEQALRCDRLRPLAALVASASRPATDTTECLDWYAQCWGVVSWLAVERRSALADYLASLGGAAAWRAAARVESFERCFGGITRLEQAWLDHWRPRVAANRCAMPARRPAARRAT